MNKAHIPLFWMKLFIVAGVVGGAAVLAQRWIGSSQRATVEVVAPLQLSPLALDGGALFETNCAECHGRSGGGTETGPPLVHKIYEPGHHADLAFVLATQVGVRAHHWPFGDMPPQPRGASRERYR